MSGNEKHYKVTFSESELQFLKRSIGQIKISDWEHEDILIEGIKKALYQAVG